MIPLFFSISCLQTERANASLYARFEVIVSIESHIAIIRAPMVRIILYLEYKTDCKSYFQKYIKANA